MKYRYWILSSTREIGDIAFIEDGVTYYIKWFEHLPHALHGAAIIGFENIASANFEFTNK